MNGWNTKLLSSLILIIAIFGVIYAKDVYYNAQVNKGDIEKTKKDIEDSQAILDNLKTIETKLKDKKEADKVKQYAKDFTDKWILEYIYKTAEKLKDMEIKSINMTKWKKNEYGFDEWQVTINADFKNEEALLKLIDEVISEDAEYRFFLGSLSYPIGITKSFSTSVPLKIYYK